MVASIAAVFFTFRRDDNQLTLAQFRLDEHNRPVLVQANVPDETVVFFEQELNNTVQLARNQDITELLCNMLDRAFRVIRDSNDNNGVLDENLAVMDIDGALNLGDTFLAASDEFSRYGINLAVIPRAIPVYEVWDFYRTLADNTGGEYMLLSGAAVRLKGVFLSAINGEDTLRQAFRHMRIENVPVVEILTGDTNEQNQTADDVGDMDFDHGLPE